MKEAIIVFDSTEERFKKPYGAVQSGQVLHLRVYAHDLAGIQSMRTVILYDRHQIPAIYEMTRVPCSHGKYTPYEITFPVYDTGLYWYFFEITTEEGTQRIHRDAEGNPTLDETAQGQWQLTVYHREYDMPVWLYGGVFYHVFVDRFCAVGEQVHLPDKVCRGDWGGTPAWQPVEGRVLNNDFFGGNLQGITSKLPYLEELGVTCLYLSPIFEAYSNHKYDTGDYMSIDPMFGTEADFRKLCAEAAARGIRVICDGVFAHTGSDSIYFNKNGHYDTKGAWGNPDSPYRDWYEWTGDLTYKSWWGIDTLPRINTSSPSYTEYITGENGVIRKWLRAGASGWRLDVVDEYPVAFLEKIAAAAKAEKSDSLVLGEVWEDASNKVAYEERKNYLEGNKLDSVMNYLFMNGIIGFVQTGQAQILSDVVQQVIENYPPEVYHCLMNILGTHDTPRIITQLAGRQYPAGTPRELEAADRLSPEEWTQGIALLKCAVAIQMTLPGVPCVYYGDEAGMEGHHDPFNRRCYPWGKENKEIQDWYREIIAIRRSHGAYVTGRFRTAACRNGLYAFERYDTLTENGNTFEQRLITAVNCGETAEDLKLFGTWRDLLSGHQTRGNLIVFPGEIMILEKITDNDSEEIEMDYMIDYEKWLNSPVVDGATKAELQTIAEDKEEIRLRFSGMLNFGTAGLRGIMRAGLNGMNVYTVRYATQGLADLINGCGEEIGGGVTIAYDSRNNSPLFAQEAACVLAANGIHVNLFDALRPTPELSFALRETGSIAGINITASHNTKEYNGYKVYWSDGAQLPPEHADQVSASMAENDIFEDVKRMDFQEAKDAGLITMIGAEIDEKYLGHVLEQSVGKTYVEKAADDFHIIYTPFHGTGYKLVPEVLKRLGLKHVSTVEEQMIIDGNFPTVKSPNPENVEGFAIAIEMAKAQGVDLIIGTDPDGDRAGIVVRNGDTYETLTGNQIGVLLLDYLITARRETGTLAANSAAVKSIVSTTMANAICAANDITIFETLTGFKFIGEKIKEFEASGDYTYLFGFEESNGYLAGTYARDKDAVVASMLIAEMGCMYHLKGMNLYEAMQALYQKYGHYKEGVKSVVFDGVDGAEKMRGMMDDLRNNTPVEIGLPVVRVRDYQTGDITTLADGSVTSTGLPASNVLFYDLAEGCSAIVRPSGTEPKIKLYVMAKGKDAAEVTARFDQINKAGTALLQRV